MINDKSKYEVTHKDGSTKIVLGKFLKMILNETNTVIAFKEIS